MQVYLGFHGIGAPGPHVDDDERPYWLSVARYHAVLDLVAAHRTRGGDVGLTFDDGNRSDLTIGLPGLAQRGLAATFFIVTDRIGQADYLGRDEIRALRAAGMVIGSHGLSHVRWTGLPDAEIARHVSTSLATLSDLAGERIGQISVPFGAYDGRVLAVLRRLGVTRVYNSDCGPAVTGAWMLARNSLRSDTPLDDIRSLIERRHGVVDAARARLRQWRRSLPRRAGAAS